MNQKNGSTLGAHIITRTVVSIENRDWSPTDAMIAYCIEYKMEITVHSKPI